MVALGLYGLISLRRKHAVPESSFRETPYNILDRVVRNAFKRNCIAWFYHVIRGVFGGVAQVCSIVHLHACLLNTSVLSEAVLQDRYILHSGPNLFLARSIGQIPKVGESHLDAFILSL